MPLLPEGPFRQAMATQIADEARHVEAYARYLARIGDIAPPRPLLVQALGHIQDWRGSAVGLVLATHVVLESEALAIQQELARDFPCPVMQQISRLSARDEGRHLALGRVLLHAAALQAQQIEVRLELHRRLRCLWRDCAAAAAADHGLAFARAAPEARLETGWRRLQARFRRVGLIGAGEDSLFAEASA
nr:diiron oxygenase [Roseomonas rosulenta]